MTTLREIGTRSIGLLGARGLGDTPAAEELTAWLGAAQAAFLSWVNAGIGGPLTQVIISSNYDAGENEFITDTSGTAVVTKPTTVTDPYTGQTRVPLNGAVIQIAGGATFIYVRSRGQWVQMNALTLDSTQPLGDEFDEAVAVAMAVRAAPYLQRPISQDVVGMADAAKRQILARFGPRLRGQIDPGLWQYRRYTYAYNYNTGA